MDNDTTAFFGQIIALFFLAYIAYQFIDGLVRPKERAFKTNIDNFDLGYINKRMNQGVPTALLPAPVKEPEVVVTVKEKKVTPKAIPVKPQPVSPLFNDCVLALRSLGYKAKEAKEITTRYAANHEITTVEDFLVDAFKV